MKKIRGWFTDLSLYKKILFTVSVVFLLGYGSFFAALQLLTERYDRELYQANANSLSHVASAITAQIEAIETISVNVMSDGVIQQNLMALNKHPDTPESSLAKKDIYNALYPHAFYNRYIKSINIVLKDNSNICMGSSVYLKAFDQNRLEQLSQNAGGRIIWEAAVPANGDIAAVRQIRQLKCLKLTNLAQLSIVVDLDLLIQDALRDAGYAPSQSQLVLFSQDHAIYPAGTREGGAAYQELLSEMTESGENYRVSDCSGQKEFIICGSISRTGWQYLYIRNYNPIFFNIESAKIQAAVITAFCALLSLVLIRLILSHIFRHLDYLIQKIRCFGEGKPLPENIRRYDYQLRKDEIGQLHRSFDQMTKSVKVLRDENYDKQLLLRDATIKMLRQQIHPHFLYNTLDTINCLALQCGEEDISTMVCSLANLFRSAIKGEEDVIPLEEELQVLENYIQIQEIRFRDRLHFSMTIPEDISRIYVPKLCIQPLVENALKHALEYMTEVCTIHVAVTEEKGYYRITVANTGSQFEADLLEKIESGQITPQGSGVGLVNIDSRLKLIYGDDYGLNCYNQENMAVVMLKIPKDKGEHNA